MYKGSSPKMPERISEQMIRRRAEHNEGMITTLEELALHQQNIEKIELLGQICPRLKILYLQNNLISKIQNLHKLKELEYLNLALNNVTRIQNLQRCESLRKLDLTMNFVDKAGLLTIQSLQANPNLSELMLMGNPCTEWSGCRHYVIAKLQQLKKLDGAEVKRSERIEAEQRLPELEVQLRQQLIKEGVDPDIAAQVEDDSLLYDENGEIKETGYLDEETGEMKRPWCPATRILDHIENERANKAADERKTSSSHASSSDSSRPKGGYTDFPEIKEGERFMQRNEGQWDFSMEEGADGRCLVLEVDIGKYIDTSLIKADIQPGYIRLLIKGRLLQLLLPCEVRPDGSSAQRSTIAGTLQVTMPKEDPQAEVNIAFIRPKPGSKTGGMACGPSKLKQINKLPPKATVQAMDDDDEDFVPDLA